MPKNKLGVKGVFIIIFILFTLLYIVYVHFWRKNKDEEIAYFYSHTVNGKISDESGSAGYTHVEINGSEKDYAFLPTDVTTEKHSFEGIINDSIFKPAYADTIILVKKNGNVLKYIFEH